jgi:hypothetical protein
LQTLRPALQREGLKERGVCVGDCCGMLARYSYPVFRPLIGMSQEEIDCLQKRYF